MLEFRHPERYMIDAATRTTSKLHYNSACSYLLTAFAFGLFYPSIVFSQSTRLQLSLSTAGNQTTFHIGETVPLTLSFTGPDNKQFHVNTASYDISVAVHSSVVDSKDEPHSPPAQRLSLSISTNGFASINPASISSP